MKQIILIAALSIFQPLTMPASVHATIVTRMADPIEEKVKKMTELVGLSKEQQEKYRALVTSAEQEKKDLIAKLKTATPEEKKRLQEEFKASYESRLKKILTTAQFAKVKAAAKERS